MQEECMDGWMMVGTWLGQIYHVFLSCPIDNHMQWLALYVLTTNHIHMHLPT
jgi:hypothetical protein